MMKLFNPIGKYFSLVKFSHTVFAMPFAMIGFALGISSGDYQFSLRLLLLIILCMIFARNSAMSFNRLADRKFDALNPRTNGREIPSGIISPGAAALFVILNSALFILTTYFINGLVFWLSPVALLVILGYSLTKRITALCHLILGLGLSLAPIGAYISVTGSFSILPVIYSLLVLTWSSGFDIIYALQDDDFDRTANLYSIPSSIGRNYALIVSSVLHAITFILVVTAGIAGGSGYLYWAGALIFSTLLLYQHLIVKHNDLSKVNLAFGTTNGVASIMFAVFVIIDLF
jgi:4-hydroxybenzoate polyprenyltransferase